MLDAQALHEEQPVTISTFYKFTPITRYRELQQPLRREMLRRGVRGTITLAPEGLNATISGDEARLFGLMEHLQRIPEIGSFSFKTSHNAEQPFRRSKVKVKPELISLGVDVHPTTCVGAYVEASDWNDLISRPDVLTIDTRNDYEYRIGHFRGALNPNTHDFKDMVAFTREKLDKTKHRSVAMYCTGGIRCEKYSSFLLQEGFEAVYHLKGGILQYFAEIPESDSLWHGSCFVFDERVAVKHDLSKDEHITMCQGCGAPLTPQDRAYRAFFANLRCGYCP